MREEHPFSAEDLAVLRANPYVYSVTGNRIQLTREFKIIFLEKYNNGETPRSILESHGFPISMIGVGRLWGISQHIRNEYKKYGDFHEGYRRQNPQTQETPPATASTTDEKVDRLIAEVEYLRQEVAFLKKISAIRNARFPEEPSC